MTSGPFIVNRFLAIIRILNVTFVISKKVHVPDVTFISCRDDLAFDVIGYTYVIINDVASAANSKYSILYMYRIMVHVCVM